MKIGIPRAMLYYRYKVLWKSFFRELGCEVILSEETNRKILADGINYSIDECCLPSKIYMGHVYSLIGKCDYILVPRIVSYSKKNDLCVKFNALYDIVRNTFDNISLIDYNIDSVRGESEQKGFLEMGKTLGFGHFHTMSAYKKAKQAQQQYERNAIMTQERALCNEVGIKILIVSHPYNTYDKLIGFPITHFVKELGGFPVYADATDREVSMMKSAELSNTLYWVYNKELIGSIKMLEDRIDGIILLTAFPCGPDSLVNELIMRKSTKVPTINIILDELQGEAGLQTRIESFMDIIKEKRSPVKECS